MACWAGNPEAGELVYGEDGCKAVTEEIGLFVLETCEDVVCAKLVVSIRVVERGSFFRAVVGEGVSTNMMEGPAASSEATAVLGVGLEVNFGRD